MNLQKKIFKLPTVLLLSIFMLGHLGFTEHADAADKQDKAARRAQLMMLKMQQEMEAEKAALQAQINEKDEKLKAQDEALQTLEKQLASAQYKVHKLTKELEKTKEEKNAVDEELIKTQVELITTQQSLAELQDQHQQTVADLKFNEGQRKTLSSNLANTTKSLNTCEEKNEKLYMYGKDLVQIYDKASTYESVMRKEKFFQLKRVELENLLQSKLDQLDEAHIVNNSTLR
jgi:chromosome segregation ATPase